MTPHEEQFERIARYLDGYPVELTEADKLFLAEFRREEGFVAAQLDEALPAGLLRKNANRARAAAQWARRMRHVGRAMAVGTALAATAAAVIIVVSAFWQPSLPPGSTYPTPANVAYVPTDVMIESLDWSVSLNEDTSDLATEFRNIENRVATWPEDGLDSGLEEIEQSLGTFYGDDEDDLDLLLLDDEPSS